MDEIPRAEIERAHQIFLEMTGHTVEELLGSPCPECESTGYIFVGEERSQCEDCDYWPVLMAQAKPG